MSAKKPTIIAEVTGVEVTIRIDELGFEKRFVTDPSRIMADTERIAELEFESLDSAERLVEDVKGIEKKPKARKRAIWLVTDYGGDQEDSWGRAIIAFTDKDRAEECARVRESRADYYDPVWGYECSEVKEIPLVDFGDDRLYREEAAHVER